MSKSIVRAFEEDDFADFIQSLSGYSAGTLILVDEVADCVNLRHTNLQNISCR